MRQILDAILRALESGERCALATIVSTTGSTPQRVGAKILVYEDGRTEGTIGGGCYEHDTVARAREAIRRGRPELARYSLNDDLAAETGLICGGQMEVFIEPIQQAPRLYVVGAGHVSLELARLAHRCGFRVHVVDDREKFANAERFPDAEVSVDDIPTWLEATPFPADAFFVVVTRGHRQDLDAARQLTRKPWRYLGLIGSRAKVLKVFAALAAEGTPAETLDQVHAPIGLDIGAVTPAEIAVSIVAELIAVRSGRAAEAHVGGARLSARRPRPERWTEPPAGR
jgi:xanthine dehydrogenase accessory factor